MSLPPRQNGVGLEGLRVKFPGPTRHSLRFLRGYAGYACGPAMTRGQEQELVRRIYLQMFCDGPLTKLRSSCN